MSESGGIIQAVNSGQLRIEYEKNRILVSDGTTNLLLLGERPDGSIGYDLAPEGVDVLTADVGDLVASDRLRTFTIAVTGTIQVTRIGGNDSQAGLVSTGALGAPMFFATVRHPAASPNYSQQTPFMSYFTSGADAGKIFGSKRALYDPDTGVITFIVDATTLHPTFGSNETWEFQYFLLYQNLPS